MGKLGAWGGPLFPPTPEVSLGPGATSKMGEEQPKFIYGEREKERKATCFSVRLSSVYKCQCNYFFKKWAFNDARSMGKREQLKVLFPAARLWESEWSDGSHYGVSPPHPTHKRLSLPEPKWIELIFHHHSTSHSHSLSLAPSIKGELFISQRLFLAQFDRGNFATVLIKNKWTRKLQSYIPFSKEYVGIGGGVLIEAPPPFLPNPSS